MIALGQDHPLAAAPVIAVGDLRNDRFIIPQFGEAAGFADTVAALVTAGSFPMPATQEVGDFVTAASLAAAGAGVVLAPASLASLALPGLVYRPIEAFRATVELAYAWRTDGLDALAELGKAVALPC